jgi:hypothetical protein
MEEQPEKISGVLTQILETASSDAVIQLLQSQRECRKPLSERKLNSKQRALLTKYPQPENFMVDYSMDLQSKLLSIGATYVGLASNSSIPTLGLLSVTYGEDTPIEWLVIQLDSLNNFTEVKTKMSNAQIYELARLIIAQYWYLNAAEIQYFIGLFKLGHYGRFYGAIDPMKITSALVDYVMERNNDMDRYEREQMMRERAKRESESGGITYAEYLELKKRAESGDKDAIEQLTKPK